MTSENVPALSLLQNLRDNEQTLCAFCALTSVSILVSQFLIQILADSLSSVGFLLAECQQNTWPCVRVLHHCGGRQLKICHCEFCYARNFGPYKCCDSQVKASTPRENDQTQQNSHTATRMTHYFENKYNFQRGKWLYFC